MCTTSKNNKKTTYFIKLVTFFISLFLFSNYLKSQCQGTFYKVDGENFGYGTSMFKGVLPIGTTTYSYRGGGLFTGCIGNMNFTSVSDSFYTIAKNPANCLPASCNLLFSSDWVPTAVLQLPSRV